MNNNDELNKLLKSLYSLKHTLLEQIEACAKTEKMIDTHLNDIHNNAQKSLFFSGITVALFLSVGTMYLLLQIQVLFICSCTLAGFVTLRESWMLIKISLMIKKANKARKINDYNAIELNNSLENLEFFIEFYQKQINEKKNEDTKSLIQSKLLNLKMYKKEIEQMNTTNKILEKTYKNNLFK